MIYSDEEEDATRKRHTSFSESSTSGEDEILYQDEREAFNDYASNSKNHRPTEFNTTGITRNDGKTMFSYQYFTKFLSYKRKTAIAEVKGLTNVKPFL